MYSLRKFIKIFFSLVVLVLHFQYVLASSEDQTAFAVAKQNACLGCHAINKKIVGPSFQAIAQKYKDDPKAKIFFEK